MPTTRMQDLRAVGSSTLSADAGSGAVRAFREEDAPAVAALAQRIFVRSDEPPPPGMAAYIADVFLRHPCFDPAMPSYVYTAPNTTIRGFAGVLPLHMTFEGRRIQAAVGSSMMVDGTAADPTAGARLLRAFFAGPQDISLSDNATDITRRMWLALGGKVIRLNGLQWAKVLRPAGFAAHLAERRFGWLRTLGRVTATADHVIARFVRKSEGQRKLEATGDTVAPLELARIVPAALSSFSLRPDFDATTLQHILSHAVRKGRFGDPVARIVSMRSGRLAGGYLGHLQRRGLMRILQAFIMPGTANSGAVIDDIFTEGERLGAVGVIGRTQPDFVEALQLRGCFFRDGGFTLTHSRQRALVDAALRGDAFLNGVAGEAWTRLNGDTFA